MKFVVVTLPPLIAAPPLSTLPSFWQQPTVTVAPLVAAVGPLRSRAGQVVGRRVLTACGLRLRNVSVR
ncbi:hypothetical protein PV721_20500 [Streptomyces sp. MB09-01]|nr:hypothetical protein [Streptomyces sp. MB09-01]